MQIPSPASDTKPGDFLVKGLIALLQLSGEAIELKVARLSHCVVAAGAPVTTRQELLVWLPFFSTSPPSPRTI
jgi:hypothetical protein